MRDCSDATIQQQVSKIRSASASRAQKVQKNGCYNNTVSSFYVENFGCRATQADGAGIERELIDLGLARADQAHDATLVVLNTCTVTASADQDVRAAIRRIHRQNPSCRILVTGCYAQRAPEEIAALPGVSLVVGNSHKHEVAQIAVEKFLCRDEVVPSPAGFVPVGNLLGAALVTGQGPITTQTASRAEVIVGDIFAHTELVAAPVFDAGAEKTRPNLKVQDGCDNRCSFCIIPYVRGQNRSLPLNEVLREIDTLVAAGYREVVISGINLGRWGRDFNKPRKFIDLVQAIAEKTALERLRISSVEPMDWTDELIALVASSPRIAKHAHVPMQSGSDRVLRKMHRKYRPWHYAEKLTKIRQAMPTAAIGADVMVGFPGETDLDFEETRAMVEQLPFTYLHVFTYSGRPGTPSHTMPNQVPVHVAKERNRILREMAAAKKLRFMESFVGSRVSAITLGVQENGCTEALTGNYLKLWLRGSHRENQILEPLVEQASAEGLIGTL
jgi:threonylcarbamoyladenosine tRNA methylthiotransferase MtaB